MYSYDCTHVLVAGDHSVRPRSTRKMLARARTRSRRGANGDERGFNEHNHEGVVDDDVYFARFHDMTFAPVKDDPLSSTLPLIPQTRPART